jgi:tRNA-(ms[2]io[6]A)-hydroxylase
MIWTSSSAASNVYELRAMNALLSSAVHGSWLTAPGLLFNQMLGLKLPTDPRWVNLAEKDLTEILTDHAYCEQKAATSCISLIQQYPDKTEMVKELAPIVTEEWGHFRLVLLELEKRELKLGYQRKDEYVNELLQFEKKGGSREDRLLEKLLICALIEARSCERFRLLSLHISEEELREFYHRFMVSEAGHYRLFLNLANLYFDENKVKKRWAEYLDYEAGIMRRLELRGDRMH